MGRTTVILLLFCVIASLAAAAGAGGASRSARAVTHASSMQAARGYQTRRIDRAAAKRRYWLRVMGRPLPRPVAGLARLELRALALAADWQWNRAAALARVAHQPPHLAAWHCIQRHETNARTSWRTNTGNGYFGGLQFDIGFQLTYGGWLYRAKGTAEHWTPLEQMWTAERAHASGRGFTPWPNTARMCGLL